MRAMLLAAGRGERLRPLTDTTPKPLLEVQGKALIVWLIEALRDQGVVEVVINLSWLGEQLRQQLGNGQHWGVSIEYSDEGETALETAGGIVKALPLLGDDPFLVVNADIWTDLPFGELALPTGDDAHLVLVDNPDHNRDGDFCLSGGRVRPAGPGALTFAGVGVYHARLFADCAQGIAPLAPLLKQAALADRVSGRHYQGRWQDVGSPQRLAALNASAGEN